MGLHFLSTVALYGKGILAVTHKWSTLLTVMTQAHALKQLAVGDKYLTVIASDMALNEKGVQVIDSRLLVLPLKTSYRFEADLCGSASNAHNIL